MTPDTEDARTAVGLRFPTQLTRPFVRAWLSSKDQFRNPALVLTLPWSCAPVVLVGQPIISSLGSGSGHGPMCCFESTNWMLWPRDVCRRTAAPAAMGS